jgi:imidazolonepropionase-like amidohydrolase
VKKNICRIIIYIIFLNGLSCSKHSTNDYQLVIVNASLFNVHSGQIENNNSVFIKNGLIDKISKTNDSDYTLKNSIDANERLLTPTFIDVHNHLNFIFGDTTEITSPKDFQIYRDLITEQYIPYGVTVVRSAGGRESHIPMEQSWMNQSPDYIDYYPTGGALVSLDTKFYNHVYVPDSIGVVSKIEEYNTSGIRHIKVYSLIEEPELKTAVQTARKLNMNIFGHIENAMISIEMASELDLKNFEHAKTLFLDVIRNYEKNSMDLSSLPPDDDENWRYREYEIFNFIGTNDPSMLALIDLLKKSNSSITPTLHLYAQPIGLTNANIKIGVHKEDVLNWSEEKLNRAKMGYNVLASLVYKLYKNGITLNTGSDTYDPGKTILSEMLLLNDLGIPMNDVFKIATINSAKSINMETTYGSIEVGKKAHLILFDQSPLINSLNLLSRKTIIKDGVVW